MAESIRNSLKTIASDVAKAPERWDAHPGLWLHAYVPKIKDEKDADVTHQAHVESTARLKRCSEYEYAFNRRKTLVPGGALSRIGETSGRLVVGLGAKGPTETGITLERTWGVPIIPGSSLKGIAALAARKLSDSPSWSSREGESYRTLFGTTEEAGCVDFLDAWIFPQPNGKTGLALDVMTVHHPNYYQGKNNAPPSDMDSPTPIPFLSVTGKFLIQLDGPDAWVEAAFDWLELGLREFGVGAKTNAGYGRMTLKPA